MPKLFAASFYLIVFAGHILAQDITTKNIGKIDQLTNSNRATMSQVGGGAGIVKNEAYITQQVGSGNVIGIQSVDIWGLYQNGFGNYAILNQTGSNNIIGHSNSALSFNAAAAQIGDNNVLNVVQQGDRNSIGYLGQADQNGVTASTGNITSVLQKGNDNKIVRAEITGNFNQLTLASTGNNNVIESTIKGINNSSAITQGNNSSASNFNSATQLLNGNGNTLIITQSLGGNNIAVQDLSVNTNASNVENSISIVQSGQGNNGYQSVQGGKNTLSLNQTGIQNNSSFHVEGSENYFDADQTGTDNSIQDIQITGSFNGTGLLHNSIIQNGNSNLATFIINGNNNSEFLTQLGSLNGTNVNVQGNNNSATLHQNN